MSTSQEKIMEYAGQIVSELGAAATSALVITGDRLGLYRTLAEAGPLTCSELAAHTGVNERYLQEWLNNQAASGYITYSQSDEKFSLTPEQAAVFADESSPVFMVGGFYGVAAMLDGEQRLAEVFRSGKGIPWGDHHGCLFCGTERLFKPAYNTFLVQQWLPALTNGQQKLDQGARVADVGCGHGYSTIVMAKAFPRSTFIGFDYHAPSIEHAREHAKAEGLKNVSFEVATAKDYPGEDYDIVAFFDCLHDMGDPAGACRYASEKLNKQGSLMVVEPMAGDSLQANMNPVGRLYYAFSTAICVPASMSQEVGAALGAQAGEKRLAETLRAGGFSTVKRAAETPFNIILEGRL